MKKNNKAFKIIKKNYAMFSVVATGGIALFSFLFTLFSYVITCRYFNEWNLPKEIIHLEKDYLFIRVALTVVIFAAGYVFNGYLMNVIHSAKIILCDRKQIKAFLDSYSEKSSKEYDKAVANQAKLEKYMIKYFTEKLVKCLIVMMILMAIFCMTVVVIGNRTVNQRDTFWISVGAIGVFVLYAILDSPIVKAEQTNNLAELITEQENLLSKVRESGSINKLFYNECNIIHDCYTFLLVLVEICIGIVFTMQVNTSDGFWFYNDKDEAYVVVYQTEELVVLERADYKEDELLIHMNEQLYMERNNIKLSYHLIDSYSLVE